jgi:cytidylate kinase
MYRAVALKALKTGVPLTDRRAMSALVRRCHVAFRVDPGHRQKVLLDGADVTDEIRRPEVAGAASQMATVPEVRRALVHQQRRIGARGRVVAEGRDTGTVVFPKAELKVFLTASLIERARRRFRDLKSSGHPAPLSEVRRSLRLRDQRDQQRAADPLRPASDAVRIDNTRLQSDEVVGILYSAVQNLRGKQVEP